jgi:rhodanese-related sulfurtransferase
MQSDSNKPRSNGGSRTPIRATLWVLTGLLFVDGIDAAPTAPRRFNSVFEGTLGDKDAGTEISTDELRHALSDPKTVVLDARPRAEYAVSHIPGARVVGGKPGTSASQYVPDVNDVIRMVPDRARRIVLYCNGLYCGRSRRFAAELIQIGFTDVRRYQLGIPAWRALGGVTEVQKEALVELRSRDRSSVLVDAREPNASRKPIPGAVSIPLAEASKAKDDGRLPMTDHNTRIFVIGDHGAQARAVAEAIVRAAFHNVSFFAGAISDLPFANADSPGAR